MKKAIGTPETVSDAVEVPTIVAGERKKLGTFIVINTSTVKGVRYNLEGLESYALSGGEENNVVHLGYPASAKTLRFRTEKEAREVLEVLDSYCLQ